MHQTVLNLMMVGALVFASACSPDSTQPDQSTQARKERIQAKEHIKPSQEAQERKDRSEAILRKDGVPINPYLPVIEDSKTAKRRTKEEVAKRAIAIILAAVKAEGMAQTNVNGLVNFYGAKQYFSPQEMAFVENPNPSFQDQAKFTWRYEDCAVLLWALGYIEELGKPDHQCSVDQVTRMLIGYTTEEFIRDANLRDFSAILDQTDLVYRYHWAAVDARMKGKETPAKLSEDVLFEWHYVLNWLIGYMDQDWDSVTTDT